MDVFPHQIGDYLLVGGAEATFPLVAVGEAEQFRPVLFPTARFLP